MREKEPADSSQATATPLGTEKRYEYPLISYVLVALPIAHLLVLSAYLWCYTIGFGVRIAPLISAEDIFRITISDLVAVYICAALAYGGLFLFVEWLYRLLGSQLPILSSSSSPPARPPLLLVALGLSPSIVVGAALAVSRSAPHPAAILIYGVSIAIIGIWITFGIATPNRRLSNVFLITALTFLFALYSGIQSGYRDRLSGFSNDGDRLTCNGVQIIRRFSDYYLAVRPDGTKLVLDTDCKLEFSIGTGVQRGPAPVAVP